MIVIVILSVSILIVYGMMLVVSFVLFRRDFMNRASRRKKKKREPISIDKMNERIILEKVNEVYKEQIEQAKIDGISFATSAIMASLAINLHDKWGWGQVRVQRVMDQVQETFDSITLDYVSVEDLKKAVLEDLKINIK